MVGASSLSHFSVWWRRQAPVPKCLHRIDLAAGMLGRDLSNGTLVAPVLLLFLLIFLLAVCIPDPTARDTQSVSGLSWYSWKLLGEGN